MVLFWFRGGFCFWWCIEVGLCLGGWGLLFSEVGLGVWLSIFFMLFLCRAFVWFFVVCVMQRLLFRNFIFCLCVAFVC